MAEWVTAARTDDLPEGQMTGVTVDGEDVVVANAGGEYRALGATCTHAGCNLADVGEIEDGTIRCGCHGSVFDLATGEVVEPPADEPEPVYDVRVEGSEIQVSGPRG
jgi:glycine betaine catabolism B